MLRTIVTENINQLMGSNEPGLCKQPIGLAGSIYNTLTDESTDYLSKQKSISTRAAHEAQEMTSGGDVSGAGSEYSAHKSNRQNIDDGSKQNSAESAAFISQARPEVEGGHPQTSPPFCLDSLLEGSSSSSASSSTSCIYGSTHNRQFSSPSFSPTSEYCTNDEDAPNSRCHSSPAISRPRNLKRRRTNENENGGRQTAGITILADEVMLPGNQLSSSGGTSLEKGKFENAHVGAENLHNPDEIDLDLDMEDEP